MPVGLLLAVSPRGLSIGSVLGIMGDLKASPGFPVAAMLFSGGLRVTHRMLSPWPIPEYWPFQICTRACQLLLFVGGEISLSFGAIKLFF